MSKFQRILSSRVQNIGVSAIREMMSFAAKTPGAISLAQGTPESRTPAYIRDGIIKLLKESDAIGKYSLASGVPELKKIIAQKLGERGGFEVDPERNICITVGALEALAIAISTLVEPGDEVLLLDPTYPPYIEQIAFAGGTPVFVPLDPDGWKLNIDKLRDAITPKTKLLLFSSPSNPTGAVLGKKEIDAIVELSAQHEFFIIADSTYEFLVYDTEPVSLLPYATIRERLLICYSFSKEFSMTGWRVGYLYAPAPILEQALKVHDAFVLCAPTISQYAALIALTEKPNDDPEGMRAALKQKRDLICERLDRLSDLFSSSRPEGAFYVLARYKKTSLNSRDFALKMLHEAKVVCVPGIGFGPSGEGYVRFSYGSSKENIAEAFDRIERWNKTL